MTRIICAFLGFGLSIWAAPASAQADQAQCGDVLKYTGREQQTLWSTDIGRNFLAYAQATSHDASGNAAFPIHAIPVSFGFEYHDSDQRSLTSFEEWEREYYSQSLTVFQPAVDAWRECMAASRNQIAFRPQLHDDGSLTIQIQKPFGSGITFQGIEYDHHVLECRRAGVVVDETTQFPMPDANILLVCRRNAQQYLTALVVVSLSSGSYSATVPEMPRPPRRFAGNDTDQKRELRGCSLKFVVPPANFDRTVLFENLAMIGTFNTPNSTGHMLVMVNGHHVTEASQPKPADATPRGTIRMASNDYVIPAFLPAIVEMSGGVDNGACQEMGGLLRLPSSGG